MAILRLLVVSWLALTPTLVFAAIENRNLLPFGEIEAMTGNAGTAGPASSGSVYYNPAALAQITHGRISVSGSTFVASSTETPKLLRIDNTDLPYKASGFDIVPSSLISTFYRGSFSMGFFLLVPETFKISNKVTSTTANTSSTIIQSTDTAELWGGFAVSRYFSQDTAFGASVQVSRRTQMNTLGFIANFPTVANTGAVSNTQTEFSAYGLSATLGVLKHFNEFFTLGLRIQSPTIGIGGSGTLYQGEQVVSAGTLTTQEVSRDDIDTKYTFPFDMTLGTRFTPWEALMFMADVSFQAGADFQPFKDAAASERLKTDPTFRFNFGVLAQVAETWKLGAGFLINPSAIHSLEGRDEGDSRTNFMGVTTGAYWMPDNVRTGLALFHLWSKGELIPISDPSTRAEFKQRGTGGVLTFSYML